MTKINLFSTQQLQQTKCHLLRYKKTTVVWVLDGENQLTMCGLLQYNKEVFIRLKHYNILSKLGMLSRFAKNVLKIQINRQNCHNSM